MSARPGAGVLAAQLASTSVLETPGAVAIVRYRDGRKLYCTVIRGRERGNRIVVVRPLGTRVDLRLDLADVRSASVVASMKFAEFREIAEMQRARRWP